MLQFSRSGFPRKPMSRSLDRISSYFDSGGIRLSSQSPSNSSNSPLLFSSSGSTSDSAPPGLQPEETSTPANSPSPTPSGEPLALFPLELIPGVDDELISFMAGTPKQSTRRYRKRNSAPPIELSAQARQQQDIWEAGYLNIQKAKMIQKDRVIATEIRKLGIC